jgi:hypothetical protein
MSTITRQLDATLERMEFGRALKGELLMTGGSQPYVPYAQPLLDAVSLFESLGLGYALIGGIAAMYYGQSRFTQDVDFVAVTGHMEAFAAHPEFVEANHFASDCNYKLYHQSGVQVDLWRDPHADGIIARAVEVKLAGRSVKVIEPHDLIAMKLRARRLKDDDDVSQILLHTPIDESRLASLVSADELSHFAGIKARM